MYIGPRSDAKCVCLPVDFSIYPLFDEVACCFVLYACLLCMLFYLLLYVSGTPFIYLSTGSRVSFSLWRYINIPFFHCKH